jgi:hypothetical protein
MLRIDSLPLHKYYQSIATQAKEVFTNDGVCVTLKGMQLIINVQES